MDPIEKALKKLTNKERVWVRNIINADTIRPARILSEGLAMETCFFIPSSGHLFHMLFTLLGFSSIFWGFWGLTIFLHGLCL
jgi:hypothetical protein